MRSAERLIRIMCAVGTTFALTGCSPDQSKAIEKTPITREAPPKQDQTKEIIHQEVIRLIQRYPQNSIVRTVYLGNLADISPVFTGTLPVGVADPRVSYARTQFGQAEYAPTPSFNYRLNQDLQQNSFTVLKRQEVAVYLSPVWLNSKNDEVKTLALEKEAYTIALWEPFSSIVLNTYLTQGKISKIDPKITDAEIAHTLARQMLIDNLDVRKLYDYAGYLAILPKVGPILASQNPEAETELGASNLPKIYKLAKKNNIQFENLEFGSQEFLQAAFNNEGPWAKMILDPSIAGPVR